MLYLPSSILYVFFASCVSISDEKQKNKETESMFYMVV